MQLTKVYLKYVSLFIFVTVGSVKLTAHYEICQDFILTLLFVFFSS
jgi:hypothetical protein